MVLRFFRSSFFSQYLAICLAGLLLWGRGFFYPAHLPLPEGPVPLYRLLYNVLAGIPVTATILGFIVSLISAFLANYLLVHNEIVNKNSSLTGFLFIIFTGFHPALLILNPVSIVLLLLLLTVNSLFDSYNKTESQDLIYLAGFLIGTGSFIYFPFLAFYGFILVALILFRSSNWREWLSSLLGLLTPYLFLSAYYFWFDELLFKWNIFVHSFAIYLKPGFIMDPGFVIQAGVIVLVMIAGWLNSVVHLSEKTIEIRKKAILLNWLVLFVILSLIFGNNLQTLHFLLIAGCTAFLMAMYLLQLKRSFWQEIVLILVFVAFVVGNFLTAG